MPLLKFPPIHSAVARIRNRMTGRQSWITSESDIVIEGCPRSANTYFMRILRAACEHKLSIASHVHRPEQLIMAHRYDTPCVALFRDPLESVASLVVRDERYKIGSSMKNYRRFCETALSIESPRFLMLDFEDVIAHPAQSISGVLDEFGFDHLPVSDRLIAEATRDDREDKTMSSLPNPAKDALKERVYDAVRSQPDFERARELYEIINTRKWTP